MTLPLTSPFTDGTAVDKSQLDQLVDAINTLNSNAIPSPLPQHYLTNTAGTSIPNGSDTTVAAWTTVTSAQMGSLSGGVRTISVPGFYLIGATITFPNTVTAYVRAQILVNGGIVDTKGSGNVASHYTTARVAVEMPLNAGDTVAVTAYQDSGSAQPLATGPGTNHWSIAYIGNL